jgi:hypothetical protein
MVLGWATNPKSTSAFPFTSTDIVMICDQDPNPETHALLGAGCPLTKQSWKITEHLWPRDSMLLEHQQQPQARASWNCRRDSRSKTSQVAFTASVSQRPFGPYALQSGSAKPKAACNALFALWKDADPDIPILKRARAEYAKLQ